MHQVISVVVPLFLGLGLSIAGAWYVVPDLDHRRAARSWARTRWREEFSFMPQCWLACCGQLVVRLWTRRGEKVRLSGVTHSEKWRWYRPLSSGSPKTSVGGLRSNRWAPPRVATGRAACQRAARVLRSRFGPAG